MKDRLRPYPKRTFDRENPNGRLVHHGSDVPRVVKGPESKLAIVLNGQHKDSSPGYTTVARRLGETVVFLSAPLVTRPLTPYRSVGGGRTGGGGTSREALRRAKRQARRNPSLNGH